jgi:sugar phosphate isomerase/epimerase
VRTSSRFDILDLIPRTAQTPASLSDRHERVAVLSSALPGLAAEQVVELAGEAGVRGVEWAVGPAQAVAHSADGVVSRLRERCARADLRICGLCIQDQGVLMERPNEVAALMDLAAALGAPHVRVMPPPYAGGELSRELDALQEPVRMVVDAAERTGVRVLLEPAAGSVAPSPELVRRLVERHSPDVVGVVYDPASMWIEGHLAPELTVSAFGRYLQHVHVKNLRWRRSVRDGWHVRYTQLDAGLVDWPAVLEALDAATYDGWFALDHLPGRADADELRRQIEATRSILSSSVEVS